MSAAPSSAKAKKVRDLSGPERDFIKRKVKILLAEGKNMKQALGQAFGMLRQKRKEKGRHG